MVGARAVKRGGVDGFSLPELMVGMVVALLVTGGALAVFQDATKATDGVKLQLDTNDNVRIAVDLITRDFIQVGQGLPSTKVIAAPSGAGSSAVKRPAPPGVNLTFGGVTDFSAVTPGNGLGPTVNGLASDIVNVLYVDSQFEGLPVTVAANGSSMTVRTPSPLPPAAPTNGGVCISATCDSTLTDPIVAGDLILFVNGSFTAMQVVTSLNDPPNQTVYFATSDGMNLNQRTAASGSIMSLIAAGGAISASRVRMVSYYLDTSNVDGVPRLIRRVNMNPGRVVALGIDNLQFTYDLVDPEDGSQATRVDAPTALNEIRKIGVAIGARSRHQFSQMHDYTRTGLVTQVSLRSLALVDRYR